VKQRLKVKYYIRYVDDFAILCHSNKILEDYKIKINEFLKENLGLDLHPGKSHIIKLDNGIGFLGFRIFFYHRLIKKSNIRKFDVRFNHLKKMYKNGLIGRERALDSLKGWLAYVEHANTYKHRRDLIRIFNQCFPINPQVEIPKNKKNKNFIKKTKISNFPFSSQKTLQLYKKGLSVKEIAEQRNIKESTVWEHFAMLIEYNQLSVWKVLPNEKIIRILANISWVNDKLKEIKQRINNDSITFDEINCVLAHYKNKNRK